MKKNGKQTLLIMLLLIVALVAVYIYVNNISIEKEKTTLKELPKASNGDDTSSIKTDTPNQLLQTINSERESGSPSAAEGQEDYNYYLRTLKDFEMNPMHSLSIEELRALAINDDRKAQEILAFNLSSSTPNLQQSEALMWAKFSAYRGSNISKVLVGSHYIAMSPNINVDNNIKAVAYYKYEMLRGNPMAKIAYESNPELLNEKQMQEVDELLNSGMIEDERNQYLNMTPMDICSKYENC